MASNLSSASKTEESAGHESKKSTEFGNSPILPDLESPQSESTHSASTTKSSSTKKEVRHKLKFIGEFLEWVHNLKLPLIGHLPLQRQVRNLFLLLIFSLLFSGFVVWESDNQKEQLSIQSQITDDALVHTLQIVQFAPNAIRGNPVAYKELVDNRNELRAGLKLLINGGNYRGYRLEGADTSDMSVIKDGEKLWTEADNASIVILKLKKELAEFDQSIKKLSTMSPALLVLSEEIAAKKFQDGGSQKEIAASAQLLIRMQRLASGISELLSTEILNPEMALLLKKDTLGLSKLADAILNGSDAMQLKPAKESELRVKLIELKTLFANYQQSVLTLLDNLPNFIAAKEAGSQLTSKNEDFLLWLSSLQSHYRNRLDLVNLSSYLMLLGFAISILAAVSIISVLMKDNRIREKEENARHELANTQMMQAKKREKEARQVNDQNQVAILQLMNELQAIADGDLTVQATVSEGITGAIADSVNYTVDELRGLVGRVTTTTEQVTSASHRAEGVSALLLSASQRQSIEIKDVGESIISMTGDITNVSKSAGESVEVARKSLIAAERGEQAVQNAIKGMDEIRVQLQETARRIKQLGESSLGMGEIAELIADIAKQAGMLALDASNQSVAKGETDKGFSVVAEMIQRLSECSGEATRKLSSLIKTIQTDTHDAVSAMEKSTQGVIEGAKLSDAAGLALVEIRQISDHLAELVQRISHSAQHQVNSANGVAQHIQHILAITEQAQDGTEQTAQSIRELSGLAQELRNSVFRFRVTV